MYLWLDNNPAYSSPYAVLNMPTGNYILHRNAAVGALLLASISVVAICFLCARRSSSGKATGGKEGKTEPNKGEKTEPTPTLVAQDPHPGEPRPSDTAKRSSGTGHVAASPSSTGDRAERLTSPASAPPSPNNITPIPPVDGPPPAYSPPPPAYSPPPPAYSPTPSWQPPSVASSPDYIPRTPSPAHVNTSSLAFGGGRSPPIDQHIQNPTPINHGGGIGCVGTDVDTTPVLGIGLSPLNGQHIQGASPTNHAGGIGSRVVSQADSQVIEEAVVPGSGISGDTPVGLDNGPSPPNVQHTQSLPPTEQGDGSGSVESQVREDAVVPDSGISMDTSVVLDNGPSPPSVQHTQSLPPTDQGNGSGSRVVSRIESQVRDEAVVPDSGTSVDTPVVLANGESPPNVQPTQSATPTNQSGVIDSRVLGRIESQVREEAAAAVNMEMEALQELLSSSPSPPHGARTRSAPRQVPVEPAWVPVVPDWRAAAVPYHHNDDYDDGEGSEDYYDSSGSDEFEPSIPRRSVAVQIAARADLRWRRAEGRRHLPRQ